MDSNHNHCAQKALYPELGIAAAVCGPASAGVEEGYLLDLSERHRKYADSILAEQRASNVWNHIQVIAVDPSLAHVADEPSADDPCFAGIPEDIVVGFPTEWYHACLLDDSHSLVLWS